MYGVNQTDEFGDGCNRESCVVPDVFVLTFLISFSLCWKTVYIPKCTT